MAKFKLTMKGNKAVLKGLKDLKGKAVKRIDEEIEVAGVNIQQGATQRAPHVTGFLISGITHQHQFLRSRVEAEKEYSPYVEFGTGGMVDVPAGLEEYAMQFKGKGIKQVNLPPRPFLFPAFEQERPKLIENIKKVLNEPK